jgi:2-polyprenyl-3-methyl-5-hydroxy-6-metoxy-1,4-benzoquinol methylase
MFKSETDVMFGGVDVQSGEVASGQRFEFGKNWQHFLRSISPGRIREAEQSLQEMLGLEALTGLRFLDVGSGSGLFSLAARNLGARVVSFDFDPQSVACAQQLRRMYGGDSDWRIEQGSVLDREFLAAMGPFDVVFSWGVLHHTGAMWTAMQNVAPLVKPGGRLFIAIYNDQGKLSRAWHRVKRAYNRTPRMLRFVILGPIALYIAAGVTLNDLVARRPLRIFSGSTGGRGMSIWNDIVDWVGGYPFEVAKPEQILDLYLKLGFCLQRLVTCGGKLGCNQFVFVRFDNAIRSSF